MEVYMLSEAAGQTQRHALGRFGERIAQQYFGGELTSHKSPFDLIDWTRGIAYEIKTVQSGSIEQKIRIKPPSLKKKLDFAEKYNLDIVMVSIVVYDIEAELVEIYTSRLRTSVKPRWMNLIKKKRTPVQQRQRISLSQFTESKGEDELPDRLPTFEDFYENIEGDKLIEKYYKIRQPQ